VILYLDTSSLVKLYVEETASADVEGLVVSAEVTGTSLIAYAEANTYVKEVDALNKLSDEALAKRGLARDEIVRHVFRHHLVY